MDAFLSAMRAVADFAIEVLLLIALIFLANSFAYYLLGEENLILAIVIGTGVACAGICPCFSAIRTQEVATAIVVGKNTVWVVGIHLKVDRKSGTYAGRPPAIIPAASDQFPGFTPVFAAVHCTHATCVSDIGG